MLNFKLKINLPKIMTNIENLVTVVTFYSEKYVPPIQPGASVFFDSTELKAGENKITSEKLETLRKHPDFNFWVNQGAILVTQHGVGGDEPINIVVTPIPDPTPEPEPEPKPETTPEDTVQTLTLNLSGSKGFTITITPITSPEITPTPEGTLTPNPTPTPEVTPTPTPTTEEAKAERADQVYKEARQLGIVTTYQTADQVESAPEFTLTREAVSSEAPTENLLNEADRPVSGVPVTGVTDRINPIPAAKRR
jgi:hypothetical protein